MDNINNITIPNFSMMPRQDIQYTTYTQHLFGPGEIILIVAIFVFLAYWYVKVGKDKVQYQHWTNPNGREVDLYKIVRVCFWTYTAVVIIFGLITILLAR